MSADRETRKSASAIYRMLTKTYPEVDCELDFQNPLQLVIATLLSAQCTDKRVNSVTPRLFKKLLKEINCRKLARTLAQTIDISN